MDTLSITLEIDDNGANAVLSRTEQKVDNFVDKVSGANPKINISIGDKGFIELDKLEKKAENTRKTFASLVQFNSRDNSLDGLSQSAIRLQQETSRANARVRETQKILSEYKGSNQSLFKVLSDDARAAERDLARLETRSAELEKRLVQRGGTPNAGGGANNLKLSAFQKQNLFYQANDIATMASLGANPMQIIASQAGQLAQIPTAAQASALVAAYAPLVGILGAGAAALLLTYKITGDIRAEAEKRLKVETMISAAQNKYILGQREIVKNSEKLFAQDSRDRNFSQFLSTSAIEDLKKRRDSLKFLVDNTPIVTLPSIENGKFVDKPNEDYEKRVEEIRKLNAQIFSAEQQNNLAAKNSFNDRWESYKKSQESATQASERAWQIAQRAAQKHNEEVEKGKKFIEDLGKTSMSFLDGVFNRTGSNNPFVNLFSEADRQAKQLQESTKGLSKSLIADLEQMETKANSLRLFETRIDTGLTAFGFRDRADQIRNAGSDPETNKRFFDDAVNRDVRGGLFNDTYGAFLAGKAGGADKLTEAQRRDIYEVNQLKNLSGNPNFESVSGGNVNDRSLISRLARERMFGANGDENLSLNDRLKKQYDIIYGNARSDDEKAIADRKFAALTGSVDFSKVSSDLREKAIMANLGAEKNTIESEKNAEKLRLRQTEATEKLASEIEKLNKIAAKDGFGAVKTQVELIDRTNGKVNILGASPVPSDMNESYPRQ